MIFKGFKFGMLLQLAVGPGCIFIFQIASLKGFYIAEIGVLGIAIIDSLFITVAILGISAVINKKNIKICLKIFGSIILFIFGFSTFLNQFNINFIPSLSIQNISNSNNTFIHAIILAASNPLTILFWTGVFSSKIAEENMKTKDIYLFAFGALISTLFFLTLISFLGSCVNIFLPNTIIQILNTLVGFLLMYFSVKMCLKKV
ncbi:lysine exporter protein LysE/YggA [Clostridium pasteurianum DSM 525 = ATCC 6013]|uniref:Lysine exporter protein (LYSE/YGGA) n=1 Tax=Clostridium pasteurianum DSM 525 = ATCC 6013 TaxID=1262449 RepID=A0A0H3J6T9_CLOPA|nr:LysE family transporter [Clostridium pasteurianum]AJA46690.1 lysine exporter protein LysE/YggA [Clostridium pasteurianum DSM 525 = ATCC 6013]AJA50678.1 lysine exporter protein LysE/YggA [Clostridium pasteurianum DSM 525 = ATCC 6013]AOZ74097.1 lysine transporter LysE [Clostridium pasteurianum DSM 525 = ATCC 6013]AOZ77894.1 lysine transporter LysE [Clostridium pasteurianum]ELP61256.1 lysine exporter protein LysE/YggA [Clostridium pasteurianum DSM 525 = ATCC 6013]